MLSKVKWTLLLLACTICPAQETRKNPFESSALDTDVGRATFRIRCAPCHGIGGEGGHAPDLTLGTYSVGSSNANLFDVVAGGIPGTEMPGFGTQLNNDSTWRIVSYLRSIARRDVVAVSGNPRTGETIFVGRGQCSNCHRVYRKGGRLGPDLSRGGQARSVAYLRAALVSPDERLTPGYSTVTVTTSTGEKISGVAKNIDNFSVQLMDPQENIRSFLKSDVRAIDQEFHSLMPSYENVLSEAEINDVLAYLVSLKGEENKQ